MRFPSTIPIAMVILASPLASQAPILRLGGEQDAGDAFARLADLAFDSNSRLIILDDSENRVVVIGLDGKTKQRLGRTGSGPGEYRAPTTLMLTASGQLLVFDPATSRATQYDART